MQRPSGGGIGKRQEHDGLYEIRWQSARLSAAALPVLGQAVAARVVTDGGQAVLFDLNPAQGAAAAAALGARAHFFGRRCHR